MQDLSDIDVKADFYYERLWHDYYDEPSLDDTLFEEDDAAIDT